MFVSQLPWGNNGASRELDVNQPDSVWSYLMPAQSHPANGQVHKAIADYRQGLALHLDDKHAKEQINSLTAPNNRRFFRRAETRRSDYP
jgi:hypothetical protein